ncbi:alanine racemase [Rhodovulum imhoffii]|nr:alanine racemase [Rhodovulum imhoffii]MBK5934353.1 alanine racemase [Rhodovulum imhoffii]
MATGFLTIDLDALARNWTVLDKASGGGVESGAVVKANGYGLGASAVARRLARAGARRFFVAAAEEGAAVRRALGPGPEIGVFGGHMAGDADKLRAHGLVPMLNSIEQLTRHFEALPGHPFGVQIDSGMNRLGLEPAEWAAVREIAISAAPRLVMSHLACADDPDHPINASQLRCFREMTDGCGIPRSLSATGGILLGADYHFEVTRPGIGVYGGRPFEGAEPVVTLDLPVIQVREVMPGEAVGYGVTWKAEHPTRVATVAAGYADGIFRYFAHQGRMMHHGTPCPILGRVSMDLITVDVTHLPEDPVSLQLLGESQTVDDVADAARTIGYEILTSLGARYGRRYLGGGA